MGDTILFLRWNSADTYGQIEKGGTYDFDVAGWRVPFLSWYPNVLAVRAAGGK